MIDGTNSMYRESIVIKIILMLVHRKKSVLTFHEANKHCLKKINVVFGFAIVVWTPGYKKSFTGSKFHKICVLNQTRF